MGVVSKKSTSIQVQRDFKEKTFTFGLFVSCVINDFCERQAEFKPEPFISCLEEQVIALSPVFHGS